MDATQSKDEKKRFIVKVGGEAVDLTDYPPITQGDKKRMAKELGFTMKQIGELTDEQEATFVCFLLKKVRPHTSIEEVDALPAAIVQDIGTWCLRRSTEVDSPFSKRSTSSPANTAGPSSTSSAEAAQSS